MLEIPADPMHERNLRHHAGQEATDICRQRSDPGRYYPRREAASHQNIKVATHGYHWYSIIYKSLLTALDTPYILAALAGGAHFTRPVLL